MKTRSVLLCNPVATLAYLSSHFLGNSTWTWRFLWNNPRSSLASLSQLLCTSYRILDSVGEGEGGIIWENTIKTYILSYVKQRNSVSSIHEAGHSKLMLWDNPEGWDGKGDGRGFRTGGHMSIHGWCMSMYSKGHHNIVKQLVSN